MFLRIPILVVALIVGACGASPTPTQSAQPLALYPEAAEVLLFANSYGFEFPDGVSLENTFDRQSGAALTDAEAAIATNAVSIAPPPNEVAACAHVWRHAFLFYDAAGAPLGALAYCRECGAVRILGPAAQQLPNSDFELRYDSEGLNRVIEAHNLIVEEHYPE